MKQQSFCLTALTAITALALTALTARAQLATGISLNFDANDPASGIDGANWDSLTADTYSDFNFGGDVTLESVTSSGSGVTKAYRFTGVSGDTNKASWNGKYGDGVATTWELWIKPSDTGDAGQTILESGGSGTGFSIWYAPGTVGDGSGTMNLTIDGGGVKGTVSAVIDTSDFHHVTVLYDRDFSGSIDLLEFYVDGVFVDDNLSSTTGDAAGNDTDHADLNDYCGGDPGGLGNTWNSLAETAVGGQFEGDISVFRVWGSKALTPAEIAANYSLLGGPDTSPPAIAGTSPADDSTGAYPAGNLVATFSEEIALKSGGTITITDTDDGSGTQVINLLDASQVTVSGTGLIIDPASNLEFGTNYEVTIDGSSLEDTADTPNVYLGTVAGEWTFTTAAQDLSAPVITGTDPLDNAVNVLPDANLVATFDENIVVGTGNIRINDVVGLTTVATIAVTDLSQVSISGSVLTINPTVTLPPALELAVQIDSGALENFSNVDFGGISDDTTWSFTTASTTTYTGANTTNNDTWNNASNWDIAVPAGALDVVIPAGKIALPWSDTTPTYTGDLSIGDGSTLQIGWTTNRPNSYNALGTAGSTTITMGAGALIKGRTSGSPNVPAIVLTGDAKHRLGESTQAPASPTYGQPITGPHTFTIESNASGPTVTLAATNTFSELVISAIGGRGGNHGTVKATATGSLGAGDVTITTSDGNKTLKLEFDVSSAMSATGTLSINGGGPSGNGTGGVRMDADNTIGFLNIDGFPRPAGTYGRIGTPASVTNEVAWIEGDSVLTVSSEPNDTTGPAVVSMSPADDTLSYGIISDLVLSFDEPVALGSGNILVKNLTDLTTETIPVTDTSRVSVSGNEVIINPTLDGIFGKSYAVQIDSGAVTDLFGNGWGGIADDTTWNFTAATPPVGGVLVDTDFETGTFEEWSPGAGASLYEFDGVTTPDLSTSTPFAAELYSGRTITLTDALLLHSFGYESVTISISHKWVNASSTRRFVIRYAADGVNFIDVARTQQSLGTPSTVTLTEGGGVSVTNASSLGGYTGAPLTDQAKFRLYYSSNQSSHRVYLDDILITGTADSTAPTVVSIADDQSGGPVNVGNPVVYTVTFDEPMNPATIGTDDFENVAGAGITVDSVSATADPAVYTVTVTPTSPGDLILRIKAGAVLGDSPLQNPLDTTSAIADNTTITVEAGGGTPYDIWAAANGLTGGDALPTANPDSDTLVNQLEFAFGTDPGASTGDLVVSGGSITQVGLPIAWIDPVTMRVYLRYSRRADYASVVLGYTEEFSPDDLVFETGDDAADASLSVIGTGTGAGGVAVEAVQLEFPWVLTTSGRKARFGRIDVTSTP